MGASNIPGTEFKILAIRMLNKLRGHGNHKENQSKMKETLSEMKNNLQGISRVDEAENQISNREYKEAKNNQSE